MPKIVVLVKPTYPLAMQGWTVAEVNNKVLGDLLLLNMKPGELARDAIRRCMDAGDLPRNGEGMQLYGLERIGTIRQDRAFNTAEQQEPLDPSQVKG